MAVDPAFGSNSFGAPKMYTESETLANNIMTALFGRPGCYPTMPDFGMYIQGEVMKLYEDIDPEMIKNNLINHCSDFSGVVQDGSFEVLKTQVKGTDGYMHPIILISIPAIIRNKTHTLQIGVTYDGGETKYNFGWTK